MTNRLFHDHRLARVLAGCLTALALLAAGAALPAQGQASKDAHPDWSGYYRLATPRQLAGTGFKQDAPGEQLNALIIPHLQPWAKARMEATDGIAEDTGQVCLPDGIFRYPSMGGIFEWLEEPDRILMVFSNINTAGVKRIYLDRPHPKRLAPTWNGDSIGRWEREAQGGSYALLIDTIGFNDKSWLFGAMQPHTEEAHMMERVRQIKDGILEITITVEDRHALTSPYTYKRYHARQPGEMPEEICNEDPDTWKQFRNDAIKKDREKAAKQAQQAQ